MICLFKFLFISLSIFFMGCGNPRPQPVVSAETSSSDSLLVQLDFVDSVAHLSPPRLSHEAKEHKIDSMWQVLRPQIPKMNLKSLNHFFYKRMIGTLDDKPVTAHFNYGHHNYKSNFVMSVALYDSEKPFFHAGSFVNTGEEDHLTVYFTDNAIFYEIGYMLKGSFVNPTTFKGIMLNTKNFKYANIELQEQYLENTPIFDMTECFRRQMYKGRKPKEQQEDSFYTTYVYSNPLIRASNKQEIYNFLKSDFKIKEDCDIQYHSFRQSGESEMRAVFPKEDYVRNNEYCEYDNNNIYWNDDNLLVIADYGSACRDLLIYCDDFLQFETYDLQSKRKLTKKDVFKPDAFEQEGFDKAILTYWGSDTTKTLNVEIENGFTSNGFFLLAYGNHGRLTTPYLIPYSVVEPFLKDDFKANYWKKR